MQRRSIVASFLALLVAAACRTPANSSAPPATQSAVTAGDVPTYRGDAARTGDMPGPGPSTEPPLAWTFEAGGPIRSSPAVVARTVYVACADGVIHALDLETGTQRWSASLDAEVGSASPLVVDGQVVVGDRAGVVHALAVDSGAEIWRSSIDGPVMGAAAAARGSIFVATETGAAYALDPATGETRWQAELPAGVTRSIAATDDLVYAPVSGGSLVALRTADGVRIWDARIAADGDGGTPTVGDNLVFAPTGLDDPDPSNRVMVALDAADGTERWRYASPSGEVVYAPAVRDGWAWIVAEDGSVVAVDAASGEVRWTATTGAPNDALASIWETTVYVANTGGSLQALDTETGTLAWQVDIVGIPYSPVVTGGLVLVGTNVGVLYAFGEPVP